eukprot:6128520-Heterocapsa_arctica.AAC.1
MAEEWTMGEVKVLEGSQGMKGPTQGTLQVGPSVENMPRAMAHSELPQSRTCENKSGREDRQGGGYWRRMCAEELHHVPGKKQHQRLQERHVRHEQQPDTGTMEQDEGKDAVHELDRPGEDR